MFRNFVLILFLNLSACADSSSESANSIETHPDTAKITSGDTVKYLVTFPDSPNIEIVLEDLDTIGYRMSKFKEGVKLESGSMFHGIKIGYWNYYDSLGSLILVHEYVPIMMVEKNQAKYVPALNRNIEFDDDGFINQETSYFYDVIPAKDTFSIDELIEFDIEYRSFDKGDSIYLEYGQYTDPFYIITDESSKKEKQITGFPDNLKTKVKLPATRKGSNVFNGVIFDFKNGDTNRVMFVKYKYFVK